MALQQNVQEERLTDTYEFHDIRMVEVAKELQLLDVHCTQINRQPQPDTRAHNQQLRTLTQLAPKLGDRNAAPLELANVHVLEATAANLFKLRQLLWRNLTVVQA